MDCNVLHNLRGVLVAARETIFAGGYDCKQTVKLGFYFLPCEGTLGEKCGFGAAAVLVKYPRLEVRQFCPRAINSLLLLLALVLSSARLRSCSRLAPIRLAPRSSATATTMTHSAAA
jgi:hypothetical protein